jgi:uncharacterized glyoxalase superfamily protein PhnB
MCAVIKIGDSNIMCSDKWAPFMVETQGNLFLYVVDVDATVATAASHGALPRTRLGGHCSCQLAQAHVRVSDVCSLPCCCP